MFAYLLAFLLMAPSIVVTHYDEFIKDCMNRSGLNWFTQYDKYVVQGWIIACISTTSVLYCRVIHVLRRQSKVHARRVANPTCRMATSSSTCNEGGQTVGPKSLNEDGVGQTKDQTDEAVVRTALDSMHSENLDESQANGVPIHTNHGSPHLGNVETVSGKHRKMTAPNTDATDTAPVVVAVSSQMETKHDQSANNTIRLSEKKLTVMLGTITVVYFFSLIPLLTGRYIPIESRRAFMNRSDVHHTIYAIIIRFYEINSCINLFVYWQLNKRFRQDCKEIFKQVKRAIFKK